MINAKLNDQDKMPALASNVNMLLQQKSPHGIDLTDIKKEAAKFGIGLSCFVSAAPTMAVVYSYFFKPLPVFCCNFSIFF
ncbi:MAG TPA: hypothetical protein VFW07_14090 [Parafilimonas sp.]|nr:hypothetical protein [Parafilimonas sp.]